VRGATLEAHRLTRPRGELLRELLLLAWPVILSRSTQAVVGLADALMCARLGDEALAAVTTGAIDLFAIAILPMGTAFIVQSFAAQLQGRGDLPGARRFGWYGLVLAGLTTIFALAATPFLRSTIARFGFAPGVTDLMGGYMEWRFWSIGAYVAVEALGNWFGGLGDTRVHMRASVLTMVINVLLNWVLIFGHWGVPAMGVRGAALASALATMAGLVFMLIAFLVHQRRIGEGRPLGLRRREFVRMLRFGVPNGINWFLEIAAFTLFLNAIVGKLGTASLAAMTVILQINSIAFMPAFGLASAGAVLVGQAIGRGEPEQVPRILRLTAGIAFIWMMFMGLVYFTIPGVIMSAFASGAASLELIAVGSVLLRWSAAWQAFDAFGITIGEALRAAGDTAWCMWLRLLSAWIVFLPLAWWWVTVKNGGPAGAIGAIVVYVALLSGAFVWRFRSGVWRRIELVEAEPVLD